MEENEKYKSSLTTAEAADKVEETPRYAKRNITNSKTGELKEGFAKDVAKVKTGRKNPSESDINKVKSEGADLYKNTRNSEQEEGWKNSNDPLVQNKALRLGEPISTPGPETNVNKFFRGLSEGKAQYEIGKLGTHPTKIGEKQNPYELDDEGRAKMFSENKELFAKYGIGEKDNPLDVSAKKLSAAISSGIEDDQNPVKDYDFFNILREDSKDETIKLWRSVPEKTKEKIVKKYSNDIGKILKTEVTDNNIKEIIPKLDEYILKGNFEALGNYEDGPIADFLDNIPNLSQEDKEKFVLQNKEKLERIFGNFDYNPEEVNKIFEELGNAKRGALIRAFKKVGLLGGRDESVYGDFEEALDFIGSKKLYKDFLESNWDNFNKIEEQTGQDISNALYSRDFNSLDEDTVKKVLRMANDYITQNIQEEEVRTGNINSISELIQKYDLYNEENFWDVVDDFSSEVIYDAVNDKSNGKTADEIIGKLGLSDEEGDNDSKINKKDIINTVTKKVADDKLIKPEDVPLLKKLISERISETFNDQKKFQKIIEEEDQKNIEKTSKGYSKNEEYLLPLTEKSGVSLDDIKKFVRGYIFNTDKMNPTKIEENQKEGIVSDVIQKFNLENSPEMISKLSPVIGEYVDYANNFAGIYGEPNYKILKGSAKSGVFNKEQMGEYLEKVKNVVSKLVEEKSAMYGVTKVDPKYAKKALQLFTKIDKEGNLDTKEAEEIISTHENILKSDISRGKENIYKPLKKIFGSKDTREIFEGANSFEDDNIQEMVNSNVYDAIRNYGPYKYHNMDFNDFLLNSAKDDRVLYQLKKYGTSLFKNRFDSVKEEQAEKQAEKQDIRA